MHVTRIPPGLRLTQLAETDVPDTTELVAAVEHEFFGRSETNQPEILGTLRAPELNGSKGTAALWDGEHLVAVLLAYDELEHHESLYLDLFVHPEADRRRDISECLLTAAGRYGRSLGAAGSTWLKGDNFAGDTAVVAAFTNLGYAYHRTYLRMRRDYPPAPPPLPAPESFTVRTWSQDDWQDLHRVISAAFVDHYDYHPVPFEVFQGNVLHQTTDRAQWRLAFVDDACVGVCMGSNRYAVHGLGYVESLAVLREYRGRGIARHLLLDAFARDAAAGRTGTALHCDAANPTGATALYESVGMHRDQEYAARRARLDDVTSG